MTFDPVGIWFAWLAYLPGSISYPFPSRVAKIVKVSPLGIGLVQSDTGIVYVGEKNPDSAAALCDELHEDDRFVSINGTSTLQYDIDQIQDCIGAVAIGQVLEFVCAHKDAISDSQVKAMVNGEAKISHIVNVPEEHKDKTVTEVLEHLVETVGIHDKLYKDIKSGIYDMTVPLTTRPPRQNEVDGVNYHFVTNEEFDRLVKEKKMMEFGEKNGVYYGTLKIDTDHVKPGENRLSRRKQSQTMKQALAAPDSEATVAHLLGIDAHPELANMPVNHFLKTTPMDHPQHADSRKKVQALVYDMTIPYTTRPMRDGEVEGREYYFVNQDAFALKAKDNFFLEVGTKNGVYYGTPKLTAEVAQKKAAARRATMQQAVAAQPKEATIAEILQARDPNQAAPTNQTASGFLANTDPAHPELGNIRTKIKMAIYDLTVPLTTRAPREGEVNGREYNFVSRDQFEQYIQNDKMLEYGEKNGVFYGTLKVTQEEIANSARPLARRSTMKEALQEPGAVAKPFVTVGDATASWSETLV